MLIPDRKFDAKSGSEFVSSNMSLSGSLREENIVKECLSGNIPDFLRKFVPVEVSQGPNTITYMVMPDYLCIGSNYNYIRMPMSPLSAQKIADQYDCSLPTRKMVNDIWKVSVNKLDPQPWGPPYDASMMSTNRYTKHNERIQKQIIDNGFDQKKLTSGHKKDVVLTNQLYPNNPKERVAIYGWIYKSGKPIQGLNYWSHEDFYADYSHGIRLIANDVMVNNKPVRLQDVFADTNLSALISDEGIMKFTRY